MTNWEAFDTPRLWAMVSGEGGVAAWEQVAAWDEVAGAVEQHRARLVAVRSSLVAAWPPDRSEAADAFVGKLDDLIARVDAAQRDASATATGLATIVDALGRAKAEIEPLYVTYRRVTADWVPAWLDHAEHELDQRARMHMAAAEAAVEQSTLPVPESFPAGPAVSADDPAAPARDSGIAAGPVAGSSPQVAVAAGAGAGSTEHGPASPRREPSSPILASARPWPDLVPATLPGTAHGVPPDAPPAVSRTSPPGSPPMDLPSTLPSAAPSGRPPPPSVGPSLGSGPFRGYAGRGPSAGPSPGIVGSGSGWTGVRGPGFPGPSVPGPSVPGPSVPGPSVPGPSVPGPSVPGPSVPGPGFPGPGVVPGTGAMPGSGPSPSASSGSAPLGYGPAAGSAADGTAAANAIGGYAGGTRPGIRPRPGGSRGLEPADDLRADQPSKPPGRGRESPWMTAVGVDPVIAPPPCPGHDPGPIFLGRR